MARKWSAQDREEVGRLYRDNLPVANIAQRFGVSSGAILKVVRRTSIPSRDRMKLNIIWTDEAKEQVAIRLRDGMSAAQIAACFGCTRNAIIGIVGRNKELKEIGFTRQSGVGTLKEFRKPRPVRIEPVPADIIQLVERVSLRTAAPRPQPVRQVEPKRPVAVNQNVNEMVAEWLAKNGGPRKFGMRDGSDYFSVKMFLHERGYQFSGGYMGASKITKGKWSSGRLKWHQVIAIVDELREAEGLPRIMFKEAA